MKKRIALVIIVVLISTVSLLLCACGEAENTHKESDNLFNNVSGFEIPDDLFSGYEEANFVTEPETEALEKPDGNWFVADDSSITTGVYFVGKDMRADSYVLTCKEADYSLSAYVFDSVDSYCNYHKSSRFTVGEENDALQANAMLMEYLYVDESCWLNLQDGYVLVLGNGRGTMIPESGAETNATSIGTKKTLRKGVYMPGDIKKGSYMLTCTETDGSMFVVIFENKAAYNAYMNADSFTIGEENAAIEQNAMADMFFYEGDTVYLNVRDDMVVQVQYGEGELVGVDMAWGK